MWTLDWDIIDDDLLPLSLFQVSFIKSLILAVLALGNSGFLIALLSSVANIWHRMAETEKKSTLALFLKGDFWCMPQTIQIIKLYLGTLKN